MPTSAPTSVQPFLFKYPEAATILGVSRGMIYKLVEQGQLRRVHIGKSSRVRADDVYRLAGGALDLEPTS